MVKPLGIGHVVLNVTDVARSVDFYTNVLGFEMVKSNPENTAAFLNCGEMHHDLALFKSSGDSNVPKGSVGLNHFAVQVADIGQLKLLKEGLEGVGYEDIRTVDHGMTGSIYFQDPDGNGIEYYFDKYEDPAEGLAVMQDNTKVNGTLALD
ncbi:MAG TPA: hypothetical protein DEZ08_05300 [Dehalococcoidia bacterium]|nr:hypothetical protein [Dehalococcoidia bacterium]